MRFPINPRYTAKQVRGSHWSVFDMQLGSTAIVNGVLLETLDHARAVEMANSLNPKAPSI